MSHSELTDRTGLSLPGIHKVVTRMMDTGIIQYTGSGKKQQIEIRNTHPLASAIKELFKAEREYYHSLIKNLEETMNEVDPKPKSAWIFGKVAQGSDEYGDPIRIALLGDVKSIDKITDQFRGRLRDSGIEKEFDVTIDINGVTLADIESKSVINTENIILLWGTDPQYYLEDSQNEGGGRSHQDLDSTPMLRSSYGNPLRLI